MSEEIITIPNNDALLALFGACDSHVRRIADALSVRIFSTKTQVHIQGASEKVQQAYSVLRRLMAYSQITDDDLKCLIDEARYSSLPFPANEVVTEIASIPQFAQTTQSTLTSQISPTIDSEKPINNSATLSPLNTETNIVSCNSPEQFQSQNTESAKTIQIAEKTASVFNSGFHTDAPNTSSNTETAIEVKPLEVFTGRKIRPRTAGQARFLRALQDNELVLCSGPAGSGKTYLAVAAAVAAMKAGRVERIMLVRPAVEAGENLGFLPGDLRAKINPYLRPLFDALRDMIDPVSIKRLTDEDIIEVIPLAYMRGRTFNSAYIILDEAQNTTISQMKMFLTRMGENSRVVVSGDTTQIDLPPKTPSGLIDALERLRGIKSIGMVQLHASDIVRHDLVQKIVNAYEDVQ